MTTLYWDCETRSTVDLRKTGVYIYAVHPTTSVTVARLALDGEEPFEWRPGRDLPQRYRDTLADPDVRVVAHNAAFERIVLWKILHPRYGWPLPALQQWHCTMARGRAQALPGALDGAAQALGMDVRKDLSGHALMLRMCRPRTVLADGGVTWWEDDDRLSRLSEYCATDVKVERGLDKGLRPLSDLERAVWLETEIINDRGVCFDLEFVRQARAVGEVTRTLLDDEMDLVTSGAVAKASNVTNLKQWLLRQGIDLTPPAFPTSDPLIAAEAQEEAEAETDEDAAEAEGKPDARDTLPDLRRRDVLRLLAKPEVDDLAKDALKIRLEAGKISTRKLDAIMHRADEAGVVRGLFGYHGANTGRYISHGVQIQNFPRDVVDNWDQCRTLLDGGPELVDALWGPPLQMISRMLRGAIIPRPGCDTAVSDFSSVEAVGVAWLARQPDLLEAFRRRDKVYEKMAAIVYRIPAAKISPTSRERQVGKTLVLGAGYQMGWYKFRETVLAMTGLYLTEDEARHAIDVYRTTFHEIYSLWGDLNGAAMRAVKFPGQATSVSGGRIRFLREGKWLRMRLPSGRCIWYSQPLIETGAFGQEALTYMGVHPKTKKWERLTTYGGRLTENAVQGLCRDLLVEATLRLEAERYAPIALVHDEIVCEPEHDHGSIEEQLEIMCDLPAWVKGFPLSAKGHRGERYVH